ncbi:hypothetical protein AB0L06_06580 [Spirillospora sp. NPDC052269]
MRGEPLSAGWLSQWQSQVGAALETLMSTFEERYGYPPGANEIKPPDADSRSVVAELARERLTPADLVTFYRSIGEVVLTDVGNAYFFHSAGLVLDHLRSYEPVTLSGADDAKGVLIASDGAGIWFAVDAGGSVYRSSAASTGSEFDKVTDSLREFLDLVRRSVVHFVDTGEPGHL